MEVQGRGDWAVCAFVIREASLGWITLQLSKALREQEDVNTAS